MPDESLVIDLAAYARKLTPCLFDTANRLMRNLEVLLLPSRHSPSLRLICIRAQCSRCNKTAQSSSVLDVSQICKPHGAERIRQLFEEFVEFTVVAHNEIAHA